MDKERREHGSEKQFDGWQDKRGKRGKWPEGEGVCEGCGAEGKVLLTDDGDFCQTCLAKMSWL